MIFGWPLSCFNTRISRIWWISSILKNIRSDLVMPRGRFLFKSVDGWSKDIRFYLLYNCFIFFAAQNVPSRIFWHFNTSEKVPSPFLPKIRYSSKNFYRFIDWIINSTYFPSSFSFFLITGRIIIVNGDHLREMNKMMCGGDCCECERYFHC